MAVTRPESDWRWHLARQLEDLGPVVRSRYTPEPDGGAQVSGARLLEPDSLRAAIGRARPAVPATDGGTRDEDLRIAASRMSRLYCASLTSIALAGLANGVGIDLSPERCAVIFTDGVPSVVTIGHGGELLRCAERPTSWPVTGPIVDTVDALRAHVVANLYTRNLGPMFAAAVATVRAPERLLWTNAAEWVAIPMDAAIEYLDPEGAAPFVADCRALLTADVLPGTAAPNPLRGRVRWLPYDDGEPRHGIQTRHLCCLVYLHSDRHGRLCQNCPLLPLPDRAALVRERRGVGMTKPGGPAELRCVEVGRERLRQAARTRSRPS